MGKYDDIINLPHHVSKKYPQMPIADRAAQFAPFAALTGYGEQIKETARTTEEFHQVSGREKEEIDQKLQILQQTQYKHPLISVYYFAPDAKKQGGHYETEKYPRHSVKSEISYRQAAFTKEWNQIHFTQNYKIAVRFRDRCHRHSRSGSYHQ